MVIRLKCSLCSLIPSLLALLNGQIIFHILLYYRHQRNKVTVRVIGMSEELVQKSKTSAKPVVSMTKGDGFVTGGKRGPVWLLRKYGGLKTQFYKAGICFKTGEFDIERRNTHEQAESFECTFDVKDLNDNLEVKIMDKNISVELSFDLNEILCVSINIMS